MAADSRLRLVLKKASVSFLVVGLTVVQGTKTSCRIRTVGQSGQVICEFSENIAQTQEGVVVLRYDLNDTGRWPEEILQCLWLSSGLHCIIKPGYAIDKEISSVLLLDIPNLKREMDGRYVCQVIGEVIDDDADSCTLTYSDYIGEDISTVPATSSSVVFRNQSDGAGPHGTTLGTEIIVLIVIVPLVVMAIVVAVVLKRNCHIRQKGPNEPIDHARGRSYSGLRSDAENVALMPVTLSSTDSMELEMPYHKPAYRFDSQTEQLHALQHGQPTDQEEHHQRTVETQLEHTPDLHQLPTGTGSTLGNERQVRLLLLGKTGSGKRTTGNTIQGENTSTSGISQSSATRRLKLQRVNRMGCEIEIMDSSGLYETNKSQKEICISVVQAVACMHPGPHAILLVIKLDNVAGEDYTSYDRLKALFDDHIKNYIVVLFTGGDELERKRKTFDDIMKGAPEQLVKILEECGNRSMVFNNFAQDPTPQVKQLFDLVQKVKKQNGGPYVCPKYQKIGESLEEEIFRRLEEKPVEVMKDLGIMKEDIESKERKRMRQGELEVVEKGMTDEREPEIKRLLQKQDEQERRECPYEEELKNMKDRIAENQEPDFTGRLMEFAVTHVKVFLKTVTPIRL